MMLKTSDNRDRWHMYSLVGICELDVSFTKMIPVIGKMHCQKENNRSKTKRKKNRNLQRGDRQQFGHSSIRVVYNSASDKMDIWKYYISQILKIENLVWNSIWNHMIHAVNSLVCRWVPPIYCQNIYRILLKHVLSWVKFTSFCVWVSLDTYIIIILNQICLLYRFAKAIHFDDFLKNYP